MDDQRDPDLVAAGRAGAAEQARIEARRDVPFETMSGVPGRSDLRRPAVPLILAN